MEWDHWWTLFSPLLFRHRSKPGATLSLWKISWESQMGLIMNGFLKVPMQFFILLVGVMVFVFYQFETSPLHFNPKAVETVLNSPQATAYQKLEEEHRATQILRHDMLERNIDKITLQHLEKIDGLERTIRQKAKILIKKADPQQETNDKDYVFIPLSWITFRKV